MYIQTKIIVMIDPVEDPIILEKYKNDERWQCVAETSALYIFEKSSDAIVANCFFLDDPIAPEEKEGDSG